MDLRWLSDVLVLLEERNMTRAANRQNITQPAFSRRIRGFESWLGVSVLDRGTNKITISPALRANEVEIRALVERIHELRGSISKFDPAGHTLTIAAQHAPIHSTFPDMALLARQHFPSLKFRMRAGNQRDIVSLFLRGDAEMLLCYEAEDATSLPFGETVKRGVWGSDQLVPVIGGSLRYKVASDGSVPDNLPAIIYPEASYFGEILINHAKPFGTRALSKNVACETAFSNGIKELVLKGLGVGWLPVSMSHKEIESGELISLHNQYGGVQLQVALYVNALNDAAMALLNIWGSKNRQDPAEPSRAGQLAPFRDAKQ